MRTATAPRGADATKATREADPRVEDWVRRRTHHHREFPPDLLLAAKDVTVSVCLPARDEAQTIGPIVDVLVELRDTGLLDEVLVLDQSGDGTDRIAASRGADVHRQGDLRPHAGPVAGKGDAMWRALEVARGDVVVYLDADTERLAPHFATGLLGPLLLDPGVGFVKGFFRRPFKVGGVALPTGGGRVTELMARPALSRFFPELCGFVQPLAGELAARREVLGRIPFVAGYGVEIAMLIDVYRTIGLDAMAQVDLDVRQNRHQPLEALGPMAYAVLDAVLERIDRPGPVGELPARPFRRVEGRALVEHEVSRLERPPAERAAIGLDGGP